MKVRRGSCILSFAVQILHAVRFRPQGQLQASALRSIHRRGPEESKWEDIGAHLTRHCEYVLEPAAASYAS